jgi:hypothetical protein
MDFFFLRHVKFSLAEANSVAVARERVTLSTIAPPWVRISFSLALASFIARLKGAGMPAVIMGMYGAEPPPADPAVERGGRVAGLIHGRNGLARPLEVPGFCLILLLQHGPSSCGQYTPVCRRGMSEVSP